MSAGPQSSTLFYRYLLLLLLPLIALAIYVDGQHYDPGLLDFSKSDEKSSSLVALLPEKADGLVRQGRVRLFNEDNLYEHINGHAEYFISAGFEGLAVAEYGFTSKEICCTADIYHMGDGANAFGVLMGEVSDDFRKIDRGFMGFISPRMLSFSKGPYYVKISAFSGRMPLEKIAAAIEKSMGEIKTEIPQLDLFPRENAVAGSLRFYKEAYRGINFLSNVFEREYLLGDKTFQVALMEGETVQLDKKVSRLLGFLKSEAIEYVEKKAGENPYYLVKDPFEGNWLILSGKDHVFMVYGLKKSGDDETLIRELLEK